MTKNNIKLEQMHLSPEVEEELVQAEIARDAAEAAYDH